MNDYGALVDAQHRRSGELREHIEHLEELLEGIRATVTCSPNDDSGVDDGTLAGRHPTSLLQDQRGHLRSAALLIGNQSTEADDLHWRFDPNKRVSG